MSRKELSHGDTDNRVTAYEIVERAAKMKLDRATLAYADHKLNHTEKWVLKIHLAESQLEYIVESKERGFELTLEMMREVDLKASKFLLQPDEWAFQMSEYLKAKIRAERKIFQKQMRGELPKNDAELNATIRPVKRKRTAAEGHDEAGKTSDSAVGLFRPKPSARKKPRTMQGEEREATPVAMLEDKSS